MNAGEAEQPESARPSRCGILCIMEGDEQRRASEQAERLVERVAALRERVAPLVPDIDPADLILILQSIARPFGSGRRFLLREIRPGVYVA